MLMRPGDPEVTKLLISARIDALRGGRPYPHWHRPGPRSN